MDGRFFLVDYTGGNSTVNAIRNTADGAYFKSDNKPIWNFHGITDIMAAPDGRFLLSCFNGWNPSNDCRMMSLADTRADAARVALAKEVEGLLKAGFKQRAEGELLALLGHADLRIRHRLGGASTVQTALQALAREDLVAREGDRYVVIDSLMREWIARKTF